MGAALQHSQGSHRVETKANDVMQDAHPRMGRAVHGEALEQPSHELKEQEAAGPPVRCLGVAARNASSKARRV
jgi:hypothetical protein